MSQKENNFSLNKIKIHFNQLEILIKLLTYWYGIEVDKWINSESSKVKVTIRLKNIAKKRYIEEILDNLTKTWKNVSKENLANIGVASSKIYLKKDPLGNHKKNIIELNLVFETCKSFSYVANPLNSININKLEGSKISLILSFEPFREKKLINKVIIKAIVLNEGNMVIDHFESSNKKYNYFGYLKNGIEIFKDIDRRVIHGAIKRRDNDFIDPKSPEWISFPCEDNEEAIVLYGLCQTLYIDSKVEGNKIKLKLTKAEIPGLISYFWLGLPQSIFISKEDVTKFPKNI